MILYIIKNVLSEKFYVYYQTFSLLYASFNEAPIKIAKNHIITTGHTQEIMTNV